MKTNELPWLKKKKSSITILFFMWQKANYSLKLKVALQNTSSPIASIPEMLKWNILTFSQYFFPIFFPQTKGCENQHASESSFGLTKWHFLMEKKHSIGKIFNQL